jgi:two-component system chemotaxis response regulator CheB
MVKVLVIDDSALVRELLKKGLSQDYEIEVVGTAPDVYIGRDLIESQQPDVITLDIEMPKMDGIAFLKRLLPQYPIPVIMVSSLTKHGGALTLEALEVGAVDVVPKPSTQVGMGLKEMMGELIHKIKIAATVNVQHFFNPAFTLKSVKKHDSRYLAQTTDKILAIGASTGGTVALRKIITQLPPDIPDTVVVQHMPSGFTKLFADKLNEHSSVTVKEAQNGDKVMQGTVFIAPGSFQCQVKREGGQYRIFLSEGNKVNGHAPSVDVLFYSLAKSAGPNALAVLLTGMGKDGATGMVEMRNQGARTIAQDEKTSVVFGMPKEAIERGAVEKVLPLEKIATGVLDFFKKMEQR